jgi:hypothetical protein
MGVRVIRVWALYVRTKSTNLILNGHQEYMNCFAFVHVLLVIVSCSKALHEAVEIPGEIVRSRFLRHKCDRSTHQPMSAGARLHIYIYINKEIFFTSLSNVSTKWHHIRSKGGLFSFRLGGVGVIWPWLPLWIAGKMVLLMFFDRGTCRIFAAVTKFSFVFYSYVIQVAVTEVH